jgi:hypothetical protein
MPPWKPEHGVELNALLDPLPMLLLQPVILYYANVGARAGYAVVFGFRTKVEFQMEGERKCQKYVRKPIAWAR